MSKASDILDILGKDVETNTENETTSTDGNSKEDK